MHLGPADRQIGGKIAAQSAQSLVPQPRRGHDRGRRQRRFCAETSAAGVFDAACLGHVAGLSVSCLARRDAPPPDRYRPVQIRRRQAQRVYPRGQEPDYWKPDRPYLDAIEWTIIPNRSTQELAFIAGKFDMTFPYEVTVQMMRDIQSQAPSAICELTPTPVAIN